MDNKPIEKIPEKLIATFHILFMAFVAKNSAEFAFAYAKIDQGAYLYDILIAQFMRHPQFLHNIIVGKSHNISGFVRRYRFWDLFPQSDLSFIVFDSSAPTTFFSERNR